MVTKEEYETADEALRNIRTLIQRSDQCMEQAYLKYKDDKMSDFFCDMGNIHSEMLDHIGVIVKDKKNNLYPQR